LELVLQRLFSTFANGWPGLGLVVQRVVIAGTVFYLASFAISSGSGHLAAVPQYAAAIAGLFLLLGFCTPIAGSVVAAIELWIFFSSNNPAIPLVLAAFAASLAMIGPGAWSIDALLFGRKHI
jgi:uncharacterized membrane protein YphA (DoxX/SURF4 family)